jgi:hypothetical protein
MLEAYNLPYAVRVSESMLFISLSQTFVILCLFCDNPICGVPTVCVCVCRKSGDLENLERLLIDLILMFVPEYLEISGTDMQKSSHVTAIFCYCCNQCTNTALSIFMCVLYILFY